MNSRHAIVSAQQSLIFFAFAALTCLVARAASPVPQAAATQMIGSAIPMSEVAMAQRAEPLIEVRAAIPVMPMLPIQGPLDLSRVAGYAGHIVARNETLESIAMASGCAPAMLMSYNHLVGPLLPGRQIIVPRPNPNAPELSSKPVIVERGQTKRPYVALTFDAGSTAEPLPKLLQTLRDRHLKVTFFVTGFWVRENPELLKQIVADGHELGNHSLTHPDMRHLDDMRIKHELLETERLVKNVTGSSTRPYFRPPYGSYNDRVLLTAESLGFLPVYWTLDCLDSVGAKKSPEFIAERVTRKLSRDQMCGSIILMHVDSMATADAVPEILARFDEMGLTVVTVSQVLNEG